MSIKPYALIGKSFFFCLLGVFVPFFSPAQTENIHNDTLQEFKKKVDSIYIELHQQHLENDKAAVLKSIEDLDSLVNPIEKDFPFLSGMVRLHQAYYAGNAPQSTPYVERALENLKEADPDIFLKYSGSFLWLIEGFHLENRQAEWAPIDLVFRNVLNTDSSFSTKLAISRTAGIALQNKNYDLVNTLARYDEYYFKQFSNPEDKFYVSYARWLQVKQSMEQWLVVLTEKREEIKYRPDGGMLMPEYTFQFGNHNSKDIRFKLDLKDVLSELDRLQSDLKLLLDPSSDNYNPGLQKDNVRLYNNIAQDLYLWAINLNRQSEVILPLKKIVFHQLSGNLKKAVNQGKPPILPSENAVQMIKNLAGLYFDTGNAEQANLVILQGLELIRTSYTEEEFLKSLVSILPLQIRVKRLAGEPEKALEKIAILKRITTRPLSLTTENFQEFESFAEARVEEIYTLLALEERENARDSLSSLLVEVGTIVNNNEALLYETKAWVHLLYLGTLINAQKGKYNSDLSSQLIADMLRGEVSSEIFYPAQLLALKAEWHEKDELNSDYLKNLLFYTERQLQHNFVFLTAEERMRLYNHRLIDIFDVYHQLFFEGKLEKYEDLKQRIISQSLFLKNALTDGNLIPDELLSKGDIVLDKMYLDMLRDLKQTSKLSEQVRKFYNLEPEGLFDDKDRIQNTWLELLESGMMDLTKLERIKTIQKNLRPGETYLETVRFNRSLSDSTAVYGAYVITGESFITQDLCSEQDLLELLNQKNSSAQTQSLAGSAERGGIGVSQRKNKEENNFRPGDQDLLGKILLEPLWPYLKDQSVLIMAHDGLLNRISFAALQWENKYLIDHFRLRHLSGSKALKVEDSSLQSDKSVLLAGGIEYGHQGKVAGLRLFNEGFNWEYLPGTKTEIEMLESLFEQAGYRPEVLTGREMTDSITQELKKYPIVHLATHGFYLDIKSANKFFNPYLDREAMKLEPLFRSGLAISEANDPSIPKVLGTEGHIMGYELASLDLRNCYLISLSACETGLGDLRNNLGVDGLPRALKIAGAKNLLISLWKVPDAPTAEFMRLFYSNFFSGKSLPQALQETQRNMSENYPASDWGAFILVE